MSACGRIAVAALVVIALATPAAGQPSSANTGLSVSARLDLGDAGTTVQVLVPFSLIIEARHPPGGIALLPETVDVGANLVERVEARRTERRVEGFDEVDTYTLQIMALETGDLTIAPIQLAIGSTVASTAPLAVYATSAVFTDEDDEQLEALAEAAATSSVNPQAVSAAGEALIQAAEEKAAPNAAPAEVFVDSTGRVLRWLFAVVVAAILAYVGYRIWRGLKSRPAPAPPAPPPLPAHEVALAALAALREAPYLSKGDFKTFYTELSAIVRRYVGDRYDFESLELTFDELMAALSVRATPGLDEQSLQHLLMLSDQVKFAKFMPRKEDGLTALNQADRLIMATRPMPAPSLTAKGLS